jgi:protein-tyrosine phosphatase
MDQTAMRLASIPNFRDIGGHTTRDGMQVQSGLLYRSMGLSRARDEDLAVLEGLGIGTVFDLRTALERERQPDRVPGAAELAALDVLADSTEADPATLFELLRDPQRASEQLADKGTLRSYHTAYREMVELPSARRAYGVLYRTLATDHGRPALIHCTTGKDRTGWAVAALLLFLGVGPDAVMREYLLSDAQVREAMAPAVDDFVARGGDRAVYEPLVGVQPSYLDVAIDAMHETYGSIDTYLSEGLGIDSGTQAALRAAFLRRA